MFHVKQTKETDKGLYESKLRNIVLNLPEKPGCYQYLDSEGTIIYVGKAKNLKRRVSSYFLKEQNSMKTKILVGKICDIKYIVVATEWDALLLENNLIKRYKPRYNILLKDDKTYPSICITNEQFPRVFKTRNIIKNGSKYYGPYSNVGTVYRLFELIGQAYKIRTCRFPLTEQNIKEGKYRECLEYHIKRCDAPCIGAQTAQEYAKQIKEIREILDGRANLLIKDLKDQMKSLADELKFEEAQKLKEKIAILESFREKSEVVSSTIDNVDVYYAEEDETNTAYVNYLHVEQGCINQAFTFEYANKIGESIEDILLSSIVEMRNRYSSKANEIIVSFEPETMLDGIVWTVPQRGDKKKLLELSLLNVKQYRADRMKQSDKLNPEQKHTRLLKELQELLKLKDLPMQIELFDNSHISGSDAVAACVVYKAGKKSKEDYRLYNIKSGVGGDDYASMVEVMTRRYSRAIEEGTQLPDLLIVDGGKGQMTMAKEVSDKLGINLQIAGLVKNSKHRTSGLLYGFPQMEVGVKPDSELFRLLEQMQDEVHRFAINFHKKKRSERQTKSELTEIQGIGPKKAELLLKEMKSVKKISEAGREELEKIVGKASANIVYNWFRKEQ